MTQHNRRSWILTFVTVPVLVFAPLAAEAGGVGLALAELCKKTDCEIAVVCLYPKITGVMLFSNITPGGTVAVKGCGFGSTNGSLRLALVDFKGAPKGVWLTNLVWTNTFVGGTIPTDVFHVKDQSAKLLIVTKGNLKSNEYPVNFRATQEVKLLPQSDVKYWCSTEADEDWCNGSLVSNSPFCSHLFGGSNASAAGRHYTCHDWIGDDKGTDEFQATLKNGWVFHSHDWWEYTARDGVEGECSQVHSTGFTPGGSWTKVLVDWITCNYRGLVMYDILMDIVGPAGVPHK
ncbi:MAG: hypothetical protein ACREI2_15605 [Nitrospiraceae bacterium]